MKKTTKCKPEHTTGTSAFAMSVRILIILLLVAICFAEATQLGMLQKDSALSGKLFNGMPPSGMLSDMLAEEAFAADIEIVHEDYDALPVNHVRIEDLDFSEGEFSSTSADINAMEITDSFTDDDSYEKRESVAYHGKVNWGTANASSQGDAVMSKTDIQGSFSLRFPDKASLSDGGKADVLFVFSDWELWLGAKPEGIGATDDVYIIAVKANPDGSILLTTGMPRKDTGEDGALSCTVKQRLKITVKIVEHGTDKAISDKYDSMLMGFVDLDVRDNSVSSSKSDEEKYAGKFAESIELLMGYDSPLLISDEDRTKVIVDKGDDFVRVRGTEADGDTLDSGFVCPVAPQGYSYYWYGSHSYKVSSKGLSCMGTRLAQMSTVSVGAAAGQGGTIEKEGSTDYVLNGTTSYRYEPEEGYYVSSVKVDGEEIEHDTDGGIYTFKKLTETDAEGDDHTIEVRFQAYPAIEIEKSVSNETPETDDEIEYTIEIRQTNEDAVLRNAVMTDRIPEGIEVIEDTIDCSEDGEVSFDGETITYTQDELAGDAAISFLARVTKDLGEVKNTAVLEGDMAEAVTDDAVITVGQEKPQEVPQQKEDLGADPGEEYEDESDPPDEEDADMPEEDSDNTGDDFYPEAPKTGDTSMAVILSLALLTIVSACILWKLADTLLK